jgi:hypothetical protein
MFRLYFACGLALTARCKACVGLKKELNNAPELFIELSKELLMVSIEGSDDPKPGDAQFTDKGGMARENSFRFGFSFIGFAFPPVYRLTVRLRPTHILLRLQGQSDSVIQLWK